MTKYEEIEKIVYELDADDLQETRLGLAKQIDDLSSQLEPQVSNANGGQSEIILKMAKDWEPQSIFFDELTKDQYNTMIALMRAQIEIFADDIGSRLSC